MARFELLGGRHIDDDLGKVHRFKEGRMTIVESDKPLDQMFKNKFRRLEGATRLPPDHVDKRNKSSPDRSGTKVTDDLDAQTVVKERKKKKLLAKKEKFLADLDEEEAGIKTDKPRKTKASMMHEESDVEEEDAEQHEVEPDEEMEEDEDIPTEDEDEEAEDESEEAVVEESDGSETAEDEEQEVERRPAKKKLLKTGKSKKKKKSKKK